MNRLTLTSKPTLWAANCWDSMHFTSKNGSPAIDIVTSVAKTCEMWMSLNQAKRTITNQTPPTKNTSTKKHKNTTTALVWSAYVVPAAKVARFAIGVEQIAKQPNKHQNPQAKYMSKPNHIVHLEYFTSMWEWNIHANMTQTGLKAMMHLNARQNDIGKQKTLHALWHLAIQLSNVDQHI